MKCLNPVQFKKFRSINPFIRSATCEYMADREGRPDKRFLDLYSRLAAGRIGIIITGYAYVMPNGKSNPGQSGIYSDPLIPAWKEVTQVVKNSDSLFLMQIVHGGRQVRQRNFPGPVWAPSPVPDPVSKTEPLEMKEIEVEEVIQSFIKAAVRAEEAGFDGVQLHTAHGYLLSQFLSPYPNHRTDKYGGTQEKRTRIVIDIIKGIQKKVGDEFILSAKMNGDDCLVGGISLTQAVQSAKYMAEAGLDFIEVSGGMGESKVGAVRKDISEPSQEGYFLNQAGEINKHIGIPVASVGGFRSLEFMEQTLLSPDADLISLCRPFIREPDLVLKFKAKQVEKAACVSCNRCFNPRGLSCWQLKK